ncbi:hypothetical protein [Roseovarius arcticus]|uniref:hypothetical protein n=1 Tax=Roseovarius arcticus TaxID=2547404 RepID=UPI001110AFA4|nr:hypothetical protein [Roseovarius arcticus]
MTDDGVQTPAPVQKAGASSVGLGLFIPLLPVHLSVLKDASVAIAALTFALIGGAYIGFGACRTALKPAWLTAGVRGPCRLAISAVRRGISHDYSEAIIAVLRRFRFAYSFTSRRYLSVVSCVQ